MFKRIAINSSPIKGVQFLKPQLLKSPIDKTWELFLGLFSDILDAKTFSVCKTKLLTLRAVLLLFCELEKKVKTNQETDSIVSLFNSNDVDSSLKLGKASIIDITNAINKYKDTFTHIACHATYDHLMRKLNVEGYDTHLGLSNLTNLFNKKTLDALFVNINFSCKDQSDRGGHYFVLLGSRDRNLVLDTYQGDHGYFFDPEQIRLFLNGYKDDRFEKVLKILGLCEQSNLYHNDPQSISKAWKAAFHGMTFNGTYSKEDPIQVILKKIKLIEYDALTAYLKLLIAFATNVIDQARS